MKKRLRFPIFIFCFSYCSNDYVSKKAKGINSLLVILFHGVDGGNSLSVSTAEHSKFLQYLKQTEQYP